MDKQATPPIARITQHQVYLLLPMVTKAQAPILSTPAPTSLRAITGRLPLLTRQPRLQEQYQAVALLLLPQANVQLAFTGCHPTQDKQAGVCLTAQHMCHQGQAV